MMKRKTRPLFQGLELWIVALLLLLILALSGCASSPIAMAETPAQKAYAIERSYNVLLEQGLELARTDPRIRDAVQSVERRTTPLVDAMSNGLAAYEVARAEYDAAVAAGSGGAPPAVATRLTVALGQLNGWIVQAQSGLLDLSRALNP
jgi:hypothetical protein